MNLKTLLHSAVCLLFTLLAVAAAGTIFTALLALPLFPDALYLLPSVLAEPAGQLWRRGGRAQVPAGILFAAALIAAAAILMAGDLRGLILVAWLLCVILFIWGRQGAGNVMICAVCLWVLALLLAWRLEWAAPYPAICGYGALATSLLYVAVLAIRGARRSVRGGTGRAPKRLQRRVLRLVCVLIAISLVLALLPFVRAGLAGLFRGIVFLVGAVLAFFGSLVSALVDAIMGGGRGLWEIFSEMLARLSAWLEGTSFDADFGFDASMISIPIPWDFLSVAVRVLAVVIICLVIWALVTGKLGAGARERIRARKRPRVNDAGYSDEVRREFSAKKLMQRLRDSLRGRLRRAPTLADFPDGEGKIRFAFSRWLKRCAQESPRALTETPNELLPQTGQAELTHAYNEVRYGQRSAPADAESIAVDALEALRRSGGTGTAHKARKA